jgi:antitoxin (DNA-binding transcriptional repressor) of toxin-antitoxin stability system
MNLSEVKNNLSKIVAELEHGILTEVILCKNGKPSIVLKPYASPKTSIRGLWRGQVEMCDDFDHIPEEFEKYI